MPSFLIHLCARVSCVCLFVALFSLIYKHADSNVPLQQFFLSPISHYFICPMGPIEEYPPFKDGNIFSKISILPAGRSQQKGQIWRRCPCLQACWNDDAMRIVKFGESVHICLKIQKAGLPSSRKSQSFWFYAKIKAEPTLPFFFLFFGPFQNVFNNPKSFQNISHFATSSSFSFQNIARNLLLPAGKRKLNACCWQGCKTWILPPQQTKLRRTHRFQASSFHLCF